MSPKEVHAVGCPDLATYPNSPGSEFEVWSCSICDARVWVGPRTRAYIGEIPHAKPVCARCVARLAVDPDCIGVLFNPLA